MPKRYRLKLPYVKEGTIVEETEIGAYTGDALVKDEYGNLISMPNCFKQNWLEEVKEEVTFTKEQADAIQRRLNIMVGMNAMESSQWYNETASWLIKHTSKEQ